MAKPSTRKGGGRAGRPGMPIGPNRFVAAYCYVIAHWDEIMGALAIAERTVPAYDTLVHLFGEDGDKCAWPENPTDYLTFTSEDANNLSAGSLKHLRNIWDRAFRYVANPHVLELEVVPFFTLEDGVLYLKGELLPIEQLRRFDEVHFLYREWQNSFVELELRGFIEMARVLGITPQIRKCADLPGIAKALFEIADLQGAPRPISVVFGLEEENHLVDQADYRRARNRAGDRLYLTTTGFDKSFVHQNNPAIGRRIAEQMGRDAEQSGRANDRNHVLFIRVKMDEYSPYSSRKAHCLDALESPLEPCEHAIEIDEARFYTTDLPRVVQELVQDALRRDPRIGVIYAGHYDLSLGCVNAIRSLEAAGELGTHQVRVYGEEMTYPMIQLLRDPESALVATCGIDAYSYGAYLLRIAATRLHVEQHRDRNYPAPLPEPVLLTQSEVTFGVPGTVGYMSEMANYIQSRQPNIDIRMESDRFAWTPWMDRCLPALMRRKQIPLPKPDGDPPREH